MYTLTPARIALVLIVYAGLFVVVRAIKPGIEPAERGEALTIGGVWAVSTFVGNYLLYRAGVMSFLPWVNDFMHTFLWIGVVLTLLYLGVRHTRPMVEQMIIFFVLSLVVKLSEHALFGTWELDHFFHVFQGNTAYILGWSLADGLYPPLTYFGLAALRRLSPAAQPA
jgi:hypothetical protein